jgi:tRNA pseudouridine38-40 synthase
MRNIKATLVYAGTHYFGFQKTKAGPTIQQTLEEALFRILRHPVSIQAASRTDRGVHARGQVVNFFTSHPDLEQLKKSVQAVLPKDITLLTLEEAEAAFHPTLDCRSKEYHYFICNGPVQLPFQRAISWHIPRPLDLAKMEQAAAHLLGERDFSAFSNQRPGGVRHLYAITISSIEEDRLRIAVAGNAFLYKMVRNLVGTLVYVGLGKIDPEAICAILQSGDRAQAGVTAPAHGLFLHKVNYLPYTCAQDEFIAK